MGGKGGWFVHNDSVSWFSFVSDCVDDLGYRVMRQGQPAFLERERRFPTMLAAQLFLHREKTVRYLDYRASDVVFYQELSRRLEEKAELTDQAWFVKWNMSETEYTVKLRAWRAKGSYSNICEVQSDMTLKSLPDHTLWDIVSTEYRFKTEPGAVFHAEAKLLEDRIEQEEKLYKWLKDFGGRVDEHGQEIDEFEV